MAFRVGWRFVSSGWSAVADGGRAGTTVGMGWAAMLCEGCDVMGGCESERV